jgi:Raf kinase inhibitor-like YbhB/YbcL family protein
MILVDGRNEMMKSFGLLAVLAAATFASAAQAESGAFKLSAPGLTDGGKLPDAQVFNSFGCKGGNRSPALSWTEPPAKTKSLAITAYDPDAPTGSGWWHWTLVNLPANLRSLPEGAGDAAGAQLPKGAVQARTDFGASGYGGACPPPGNAPHHYIFTVWALDADHLPLDANASGALVGFNLNQHVVGKATFTLLYGR